MEMNTELVCVVANIGYSDGDEYFKSVDCLESLKDIIRFLRHEDLQVCNIRRQLGYSKVLQNDLVPLIVSNPDDRELTDIVLRLLVNLTSAPNLCFEQNPVEEIVNDSSERKSHELELMSYLQSYKEAFTQKSTMATISSHLAAILKKDVTDRDEDDGLLLERILLLIRNLLYIPADPDEEKRTDDDVTIHDQVLWSLHENGIDDLMIYLSGSEKEKHWCMHVCEIVSHMFREQNAEELAKASEMRSIKEKEEDTKTLKAILEKERGEKEKILQNRGARHSRFGGAFWVKNQKALNKDQDLVYHRALQSAKDMTYDFDKMPEKKRKTKKALSETSIERKSSLSVRLFLKEFCIKFLHHGYNNLLSNVKSSIDSGKTQKNDESFYLSVMRFFMTFNRVYDFKVEYVSQTIGVEIFGYILHLMLKYDDSYEIIKPTKGKERKIQFSRRIHLALRAFKELLMYVAVMLKTNDENLTAVAEVIQSNIFYVEEYRNVFVILLRHWNAAFQTRDHLKDVIETFHLYLKLFESFLKEKGTFLTHTRKVKRNVRVPKKNGNTACKRCPIEITMEQAEILWRDEISPILSARIQGRDGGIPNDIVTPFDLTSDAPTEEQVLSALATIQRLLRCKQPGEAVAYLRASRECWPGENQLGSENMSAEDEFMCAREIFFMDFPNEILMIADDRIKAAEMEGAHEETIEEEIEEESRVVRQGEKVFELKAFLKTLARPYIVEPYCYMLKTFDRNKPHTNHCSIKMLNRIAIDLDMYPMLFQLSLFTTFRNILHEKKTDLNKEMRGFAKFILSKFFDVYKSNPMVVVELLFWKNSTECFEVVEGYGTLERKERLNVNSDIGKWTFEDEQELLDLFDELRDDEDVIEKITTRLTEKGRTEKQVRNKLVRLRVLEKPKKKKPSEWTAEETEELRNLFNEFKSTDEVLPKIMNAMTFKKSKRLIRKKLLEIGLVTDRRELVVKRKKKKKSFEGVEHDGLVIDEDGEFHSGEEIQNEDVSNGSNDELDDEDNNEQDDEDHDGFLNQSASLSLILKQLVENGFFDEIEWVQGRLDRLGIERENSGEDQWQSVPLVPITEDHEKALSSSLFKRMLKRVGISPPSSEQEAFWRISSSLSPTEIKCFSEELSKASGFASFRKCEREQRSNDKMSTNNLFSRNNEKDTPDQQDESDDEMFERFISGGRSLQVTGNLDVEDDKRISEVKQPYDGHDHEDNKGKYSETKYVTNEGELPLSVSIVRGKRTRNFAFDENEDDATYSDDKEMERKDKRRKKMNLEGSREVDDIKEEVAKCKEDNDEVCENDELPQKSENTDSPEQNGSRLGEEVHVGLDDDVGDDKDLPDIEKDCKYRSDEISRSTLCEDFHCGDEKEPVEGMNNKEADNSFVLEMSMDEVNDEEVS